MSAKKNKIENGSIHRIFYVHWINIAGRSPSVIIPENFVNKNYKLKITYQ